MSPLTDLGKAEGKSPVVFRHAGRKQLLQEWAARGYTTGAEIGVWRGEFAEAMCQAVPNLKLLCVDCWGDDPSYHKERPVASWAKIRAHAEARLQPYNVTIDARRSVIAAQSVDDGSLDYIHVDGNHSRDAVYADLVAWVPKVRVGGMVAGHDYVHFKGRPDIQVKEAVDAFIRDRRITDLVVLARDRRPTFLWMVQ